MSTIKQLPTLKKTLFISSIGKRLPTEAQWEYAARARTTSKYYWGEEINDAYVWHFGNSDNKTDPVAQKNYVKITPLGIYIQKRT
jgi:formylglycine-generating enzyme required for sulfatase activity